MKKKDNAVYKKHGYGGYWQLKEKSMGLLQQKWVAKAKRYQQALDDIHRYYKANSLQVSCAMEMDDIVREALGDDWKKQALEGIGKEI